MTALFSRKPIPFDRSRQRAARASAANFRAFYSQPSGGLLPERSPRFDRAGDDRGRVRELTLASQGRAGDDKNVTEPHGVFERFVTFGYPLDLHEGGYCGREICKGEVALKQTGFVRQLIGQHADSTRTDVFNLSANDSFVCLCGLEWRQLTGAELTKLRKSKILPSLLTRLSIHCSAHAIPTVSPGILPDTWSDPEE